MKKKSNFQNSFTLLGMQYLLPSIMIFEREEGVKKGLFERGNFKWRHSTSLYVILKNFEIDADM